MGKYNSIGEEFGWVRGCLVTGSIHVGMLEFFFLPQFVCFSASLQDVIRVKKKWTSGHPERIVLTSYEDQLSAYHGHTFPMWIIAVSRWRSLEEILVLCSQWFEKYNDRVYLFSNLESYIITYYFSRVTMKSLIMSSSWVLGRPGPSRQTNLPPVFPIHCAVFKSNPPPKDFLRLPHRCLSLLRPPVFQMVYRKNTINSRLFIYLPLHKPYR